MAKTEASEKRKSGFNHSIAHNVAQSNAKKPRVVAGSWWTAKDMTREEFYARLKTEQARMQPANTSETKGTI